MQVVIELFDLLVLSEHLHLFHLTVDHSVETLNERLFELIRELVAREVAKALIHEPEVDVGDRVVDVEVILEIERVDELPGILVEHEAGDQGVCLHL